MHQASSSCGCRGTRTLVIVVINCHHQGAAWKMKRSFKMRSSALSKNVFSACMFFFSAGNESWWFVWHFVFKLYKNKNTVVIITSPTDSANDSHRLTYIGMTFTFNFLSFDAQRQHTASSSVAVSKTLKPRSLAAKRITRMHNLTRAPLFFIAAVLS